MTSIEEVKKRIKVASIQPTLRPSVGSLPLPSREYITPKTSSSKRKTTWDYNSFEIDISVQQLNCEALPFPEQERLIVTELIYCLIGVSGTFITLQTQEDNHISDTNNMKPLKFVVSDQVNVSLRHMVMEILPLASHHSLVVQFIEMHNNIHCSGVLQALGSALRSQLNDYVLAIVELETELHKRSVGIHELQYCLQSIMTTMRILAEIVTKIVRENMCGALVLSLLYGKIVSFMGDPDSRLLLIHLTEMSAVPYFTVLQLWILKGVIYDPHQEFMITDNEVIRREQIETSQYSASYWEKRYAIHHEHVPRFLQRVSDIILRTGKYLNVIRQCGSTMPVCTDKLRFDATNENHTEFIGTAYRSASRTLLELLFQDKDLMGNLTSVKRYLLMHQGDFINEFMDACDDELSKNINDVLPMKLDNLLELTLRTSSAKHDRYKDNLSCYLCTTDMVKMMSQIHLAGNAGDESTTSSLESFSDLTGFDCFAFRYKIQWPVSLIMNNMVANQYQMLFRLLFCCKHVERQLHKVWYESGHKTVIKFETRSSGSLRAVFLLRQRMMNAIQSIVYYMMVEVIEPFWNLLLKEMERVENFDDVLVAHNDFIDKCLENCMLKMPDILSIIISICKVCSDFCTVTKSELKLKPSIEYLAHVKRFDHEFTELLMRLLKCINVLAGKKPSGKFIYLVNRINFNGFYTI